MTEQHKVQDEPLTHQLPQDTLSEDLMPMSRVTVIFVLVVVVGIVSGFAISYIANAVTGKSPSQTTTQKSSTSLSGKADVKESAGIPDKETFNTNAEGMLEEGGHESGAGSYRLIRPGGETQTVYLTSSAVDLSAFTGKKVRIYGETFASDKVGWLMDVGFIEVLK